ncbi:hypothetical protein INT45_007307 [Circinella minor]|uniref:BZIP domain-containing protein n=1 Tax=Circinella minor TaxID=1195481 RepID=A0A8H7S272_9FUNG|nr:hypothetical protein INT45_007307 [Circinella minor]
MENNNNNNLVDWILDQNLLNTSQQQQPEQKNTLSPDQQCINDLLFHDWNDIHQSTFVNSNNSNSSNQQISGTSSSTSSITDSNNESVKEQPIIQKQVSSKTTLKPFNPHGSTTTEPLDKKLQPTTGRLDFRVSNNDDCHVTDSQLKKMTSKERRQLRNKISARNFRQRRKDYITTLEEQVEQLENEKSQLKLEVKNMYGIVGTLRKENDQLRVDLLLSRQGITTNTIIDSSTINQEQQQQQQTTTPDDLLSTIPELTFANTMSSPEDTLFDTLETDFNSNTSSSLSPSSFIEDTNSNNETWDFIIPDSTWLSHAAIPRWDWSRILDKSQGKTNPATLFDVRDTFQRYPLLAPALMSIVVDHTMSMSTEELIKTTATLMPLASQIEEDETDDRTLVSFNTKHFVGAITKTQSELTHELLQEFFKISLSTNSPASITEKGEEKDNSQEEKGQEQKQEDGKAQEQAKTIKPCCPTQYLIPLVQRCAYKVMTEFYNCAQRMDYCRKQLCPLKPAEELAAASSSSQQQQQQQPLSSC